MAWYKPWTWLSGSGDAPGRSSVGAQLRELAGDLVTLEINTIVKSNMTGERMPTVPNALVDIARDYVRVFGDLRADVGAVLEHDGAGWRDLRVALRPAEGAAAARPAVPERVAFGLLFERLRWAAKHTRHAFPASGRPIAERDLHLLQRIEKNADALRSLLDRYRGLRDTEVTIHDIRSDAAQFLPPFELTARDVLIVRKIWEIGTEEIVAQTAFQLDGDIVTRISPSLTADRERAEQILKIHQHDIEASVGYWRAIVDAALAVVQGITGGGTGRPPRP